MSLAFYREHYVKHPQRAYGCWLCTGPITGPHWYCVSCNEDGIHAMRMHDRCRTVVGGLCSTCRDTDDCTYHPLECLSEQICALPAQMVGLGVAARCPYYTGNHGTYGRECGCLPRECAVACLQTGRRLPAVESGFAEDPSAAPDETKPRGVRGC